MSKFRQITQRISQIKDRKIGRIIIFTGARQVGKTTLLKDFLPEYVYLSIDDPVKRISYRNLSAEQWKMLYPKAALDEVQKEPALIDSIKAVYDQSSDTRYLLSGSSQLMLMKQVKESLAGRCVIMEMYPLTLPEMQTNGWDDVAKMSIWQQLLQDGDTSLSLFPSFSLDNRMAQKDKAWQHYLSFGAYPALFDEEITDDERYTWLLNYTKTYLERDIRDLASFRDLEPFIKLQHALAMQTGCIFNASSLASHIGVTSKTVQRYLEYLNISYQVIILPSWEKNLSKRLTKSPKIHYIDNGVLQAVLQKRGGITGNEFESLIISELYKQAKSIFADVKFYHFHTQDGREVDLLVETESGYYAFEIKISDNAIRNDARHIFGLEEFLDKPLLHAYILSNDRQTKEFSDKITAINVEMFLG